MNSHPLRPTRRLLLFTGALYHNLGKYSNELIVNRADCLVQLAIGLVSLALFHSSKLPQGADRYEDIRMLPYRKNSASLGNY